MFKSLLLTLMMIVHLWGQQALDQIAGNIFIGQAFQSKQAYFIAFDEATVWPEKLTFHNTAKRQRVIEGLKIGPLPECSDKPYFYKVEKDRAKVEYFPDGFFSTVMDDCVDEAVFTYSFDESIKTAMNIIAWSDPLELKNFSFKNRDKIRPMTEAEKVELSKLKIASEKIEKAYGECSTETGYIDDAKIITEFDIGDQGLKGRFSKYFDPGCAGHLKDIYILDLLKEGRLLKRLTTYHYEGVI